MVHLPAFGTQQLGDLAVSVAVVLLSQPYQREAQFILVFRLSLIA